MDQGSCLLRYLDRRGRGSRCRIRCPSATRGVSPPVTQHRTRVATRLTSPRVCQKRASATSLGVSGPMKPLGSTSTGIVSALGEFVPVPAHVAEDGTAVGALNAVAVFLPAAQATGFVGHDCRHHRLPPQIQHSQPGGKHHRDHPEDRRDERRRRNTLHRKRCAPPHGLGQHELAGNHQRYDRRDDSQPPRPSEQAHERSDPAGCREARDQGESMATHGAGGRA